MIELDASSPVLATGNDPLTSAAFNPPTRSLLVACLSVRDSTDTTQTVTDSTGLTWTQRVTRLSSSGGPAGQTGIWTAPCPNGATGVTVNAAIASVVTPVGLKVTVWRGVDLANPVGATGGSGTNVMENNNVTFNAYLSTAVGSRGVAAAHDWNNLGLPTSTDDEFAAVISGAQAVCHIIKAGNTYGPIGTQVTFNFDAAGSAAPFTKICWLELLPQTVYPVGQPAEADTALPVRAVKRRTIGQPSETDTARPVTGRKVRAIGQPSETDSALPVTGARRKPVEQSAETDTALPVTGRKIRAIGQPAETDTALPVTGRKIRAIGQAVETDNALAATGFTASTLGQSAETDTALPVTGRKIRAIGQPAEADTALPVRAVKRRTIGLVTETDTALPVRAVKTRVIGQAVETDTAEPVRGNIIGIAVETDIALPMTPRKGRSRPIYAGPPYTDWASSAPYV